MRGLTKVADYPHLIAEWHPTKNGELKPADVARGSSKKVWWKCPIADDHEWEASPSSRTNMGSGCPCCKGKKVVLSNCLATIYPDVIVQWHPTKNGNLTPYNVVSRSMKRVWWKCPVADDHEWESVVASRTGLNAHGCPYCAGNKVSKSNSLAAGHPELAMQWHPTKNGDNKPSKVTSNSGKPVWWKCDKGHEWKSPPNQRVRPGQGNYGGCPYCTNKIVCHDNCIAVTHPKLMVQWHPKNGSITPYMVVAGSHRKIWWKCSVADDHIWRTTAYHRTMMGRGCPCCAGKKVSSTNCLASLFPEMIQEWHPTKNGGTTPYNVVAGSHSIATWMCENNHAWSCKISQRTVLKSGCPICGDSKGERKVREVLRKLNQEFESQMRFPECRFKNPLPFDFGVFKQNEIYLIEFHGAQHYKPIKYVDEPDEVTDEKFRLIKQRDKVKKRFCAKNKIPLLVIPYLEYDGTEDLVTRFLS